MNNCIIICLISFLVAACSLQKSNENPVPLNEYASWEPENHYFRASLISLHYLTETQPVDQLKSIYQQFENSHHLILTPAGLPDGTFSAVSLPDAFDYTHQIQITICDGKITTVHYDEMRLDGNSKRSDSAYARHMIAVGTIPSIAYNSMEKQLLKNQDLSKIDGVSGATYSYYRFKYVTYLAFMKAKLSDKNQ